MGFSMMDNHNTYNQQGMNFATYDNVDKDGNKDNLTSASSGIDIQMTPEQMAMIQQYNYFNYYNQGYHTIPESGQFESVQRCHMHSKPDLNCKFCRKYKSSVHEISRLAQQQQLTQPSEDKRNIIPMTNTSTYNLNNLLRNNILASEYYKSLFSMQTFQDVVDELTQYGTHAEPYCSTATRAPSTLFCCLYKFFTMKLTEKQMYTLLDNTKSPYPRCCGLLYLRYVLPPDKLWNWFEPYFLDDELFVVSADHQKQTTIGEFAESLLVDDKYFNTVLPRLPVRIKNLFGAHLLEMSGHRKRRVRNLDLIDEFAEGVSVSVCSKGDWLDGKVLDVKDGKRGYPLVTVALEDGTQEVLDIGYVSIKSKTESRYADKRRGYSRQESHRSRSRDSERYSKHRRRGRTSPSVERHRDNRYRENDDYSRSSSSRRDLLDEFKRREREKALAMGKDYAKRPTSYKSSLSSRLDAKHGRS